MNAMVSRSKTLLLLVPFLITGMLLGLLAIFDARQPPRWRGKLDEYIVSEEHELTVELTVQSAERASQPWAFTQDPGDSFFQDMVANPANDGGIPANEIAYSFLPYPPKEVWCILLKAVPRGGSSASGYKVVFSARFSDLYNAYWVIVTPARPVSSPQLKERFSQIGCDAKGLKHKPIMPREWQVS